MQKFAQMRSLELWYARLDVEQIAATFNSKLNKSQRKQLDSNVAKARTKDSMKAFGKLTRVVDGQPRIVSDPPLIVPAHELLAPDRHQEFDEAMRTIIRSYRRTLAGDRRHLLERFRYTDAARKVVGVGSVGTRAWILLMIGADESDPLFLQVKEAQSSVLEPFLGKSKFPQHGQRVVEGQRLTQSASDVMLGWFRTPGIDGVTRDFYMRQLWDGKGSAIIETMGRRQLGIYATMCGWTLAHAHARSGDAVAIASYLGAGDSFDQALASFAEAYADQNERDYAALRHAVDTGRITAQTGI